MPTSKDTLVEWKKGVPTPINTGDLTPTREALSLLMGFATGQIHMKGADVEHLPVTRIDKPIVDILKELDPPSVSEDVIVVLELQTKTMKKITKGPKSKARLLAEKVL